MQAALNEGAATDGRDGMKGWEEGKRGKNGGRDEGLYMCISITVFFYTS